MAAPRVSRRDVVNRHAALGVSDFVHLHEIHLACHKEGNQTLRYKLMRGGLGKESTGGRMQGVRRSTEGPVAVTGYRRLLGAAGDTAAQSLRGTWGSSLVNRELGG